MLILTSLSCKKYLSAYSQNNSFVESADDLDELLLGEVYSAVGRISLPHMLFTMDDDAQLGTPTTRNQINAEVGFHYWQAEPRINSQGVLANSDGFYNALYRITARIHTILHNVDVLRKSSNSNNKLDRISGEAHFLRALYNFMLVNTYGQPYKTATAAIDFGIPMKTDPAIKDQFVTRKTTLQVFEQILSDLMQAEFELEGFNQSSKIRANQAAVHALLSRVYLYMEEYEKSIQYANKVIYSNLYAITDLNRFTPGTDFLKVNSPEVIFSVGDNRIYSLMALEQERPQTVFYRVSDDLILNYTTDDLRRQIFFAQNSQGIFRVAKKRTAVRNTDDVSDLFLIRQSELYLNKAEALAALDRFDEAKTTLQDFLKNRYNPANVPTIHATGAALVDIIRTERRRELCFEGHRWFDLRRYGVNSKYPFSKSIRHNSIVLSGNSYIVNGYYELLPYEQDAAAYIVPIANDEIEFNNGFLFNERRPERPLKQ